MKAENIIFNLGDLDDDDLERLENIIKDMQCKRREEQLLGKLFSYVIGDKTVYYICTYVSESGRMRGVFFKPDVNNSLVIGNYLGEFPLEAKQIMGPFPPAVVDATNLIFNLATRARNLISS